jgi:hypothetical protein
LRLGFRSKPLLAIMPQYLVSRQELFLLLGQ